jgi:hypothetical protein
MAIQSNDTIVAKLRDAAEKARQVREAAQAAGVAIQTTPGSVAPATVPGQGSTSGRTTPSA